MKTIRPGHRYELENFEFPATWICCEEVLAVLIDRIFLQGDFPCRENAIATTHLETALLWLEKRTADRKARGVEGKYLA